MPAFATIAATSYYVGSAFFKFGESGWSENFGISAVSDSDATALITKYMAHRAWLLPTSVTAIYGRLTKVPRNRISIPVDIFPIVGKAPNLTAPDANDVNDVEVCPRCTFGIDGGGTMKRHTHGVPDDIIVAKALVPAAPAGKWFDITADPGDGVAAPATYAAALKNFWSFIGYYLCCPSKKQTVTVGGSPVQGYNLRAITTMIQRGVSRHKVGSPFGLSPGRAPIR